MLTVVGFFSGSLGFMSIVRAFNDCISENGTNETGGRSEGAGLVDNSERTRRTDRKRQEKRTGPLGTGGNLREGKSKGSGLVDDPPSTNRTGEP